MHKLLRIPVSAAGSALRENCARIAGLLVTVFGTATGYAAEFGADSDAQSPILAERGLSVGIDYFVQVFLALILVVGVIIVLSFLARRFSMFAGSSAGPIKILSGVSLGGKDRLLLVQVGREQILVGTSPGNVQKVHKLNQPIDPESIASPRVAEKGSFAAILNTVTRG